eukprot:scaffold6352_cov200-Isochrysis_galbana.AAC.4
MRAAHTPHRYPVFASGEPTSVGQGGPSGEEFQNSASKVRVSVGMWEVCVVCTRLREASRTPRMAKGPPHADGAGRRSACGLRGGAAELQRRRLPNPSNGERCRSGRVLALPARAVEQPGDPIPRSGYPSAAVSTPRPVLPHACQLQRQLVATRVELLQQPEGGGAALAHHRRNRRGEP